MEDNGFGNSLIERDQGLSDEHLEYLEEYEEEVCRENLEGQKEPLAIIHNGKEYGQDEGFTELINVQDGGDRISLESVRDGFDHIGLCKALDRQDEIFLKNPKEEKKSELIWMEQWAKEQEERIP